MRQDPEDLSAATAALFAELRETYTRAAAALPPVGAFPDPGAHGRFMEECAKASDLVRRIRDLRHL